MALVGGIDYADYGRWEKIVGSSGQTYYKVPGTGFLYDPFLSDMKKRPVIFTDPRAKAEKLRKQEKMAEDAASPMGQIAPVLGAAVAPIAAKQAAAWAFPTAAEKLAEAKAAAELAKITGTAAEVVPAEQALQAGAQAAASTSAAVAGAATPVQQLSTGAMLMSDGTIAGGGGAVQAINGASATSGAGAGGAAPGVGLTPYLGVAGAGLSAYGLHNAIEANDPKGAFLSGAGLGGGLAAAAPLLGFGPLGWGALGLMALGGAGGLGLQQLLGQKSTKEIQAERWADVGHSSMNPVGGDYFAGTPGVQDRNEKWLTPDAIRNNPDNYHAASDWDQWSKPQQDQFLSTMLAEGKVQEKKGGIYYDDARAAELAQQIRSGGQVAQPVEKSSAPPPTKEEKLGAALANRMNSRSRQSAMR